MTVRSGIFIGCLCMMSVAVSAAETDDVLLIDGPEVDLFVSDVSKNLASLGEEDRNAILSNPKKLHTAIDATYLAKVASTRALKRGLDKDKEVQARIWNRRMNILAGAEVKYQIEQKLADLDNAAKEYYQLHKDEFRIPELVRASHILLKTSENSDDDAILKQLETIREDIRSGKISFEDAAKKHSQDNTSVKGGDLGRFARGRMVKPFEDAVFALQPGEVSEPVKTRFGYHIIKLMEKIPAKQQPFEEVKGSIVAKLKEKKAAQIKEDYLIEIRDDPQIIVNEKALEAFLRTPKLNY